MGGNRLSKPFSSPHETVLKGGYACGEGLGVRGRSYAPGWQATR